MAKNIRPDRQLFFRLDAHYRFIIALIVSAGVLFFINGRNAVPATILIVWITFAVTVIILDWISILSSHPLEVRKIAKLQDSSRTFLFLFVITAAVMSLGAIIFLLKSAKGHTGSGVAFPVVLALISVIVSWWLVHTIFTLRYAHLYYNANTDSGEKKPDGGLQFPDETQPDYLDFVYFSFVIGMTFQVSNVEISSRDIRRLALLHSLISFAFNTAIVALSINVISGLV